MGNYVKGILGVTSAIAGFLLVDKVQPFIAIGFIVVNVLLLVLLAAHTSRYIHNRENSIKFFEK